MNKDRKEQPPEEIDRADAGGERSVEVERRAGQGRADPEADEAPVEDSEFVLALVDTVSSSRETDSITKKASPGIELDSFTAETVPIQFTSTVQTSKVEDIVIDVVRPGQAIEPEAITFSTVPRMMVIRVRGRKVEPVHLAEAVEEEEVPISTVEQLGTKQREDSIVQQYAPAKRAAQDRELKQRGTLGDLEVEDERDPVFQWSGGSPYGSRRPRFIIHIDGDEVPSLPFLQALLRDTYKELEGGEPGAERVEFIANEPRFPQVQKNIVTLDLTDDDWNATVRSGRPVIERSGIDIVPKLRDVATTLFTGELGYFVLNVPDHWEHPLRRNQFFDRLVDEITGGDKQNQDADDAGPLVEQTKPTPVLLAEPTTTEHDVFFKKLLRYYALGDDEAFERVDQVEEVATRVLRQNDWRRVAVTERQQEPGEESDEHYFWKAVLAEGVARQLYWAHEDKYEDFDAFLTGEVVEKERGVIETEQEIGDDGDATAVADVAVNALSEWIRKVAAEFVGEDQETVGQRIVLEFETGISEGAFNFRKIRETLEKYEECMGEVSYVAVIVPPRVLFRGYRRSLMIEQLVESWEDTIDEVDAAVFVPVLEGGVCGRLQPLSGPNGVLGELYGELEDE